MVKNKSDFIFWEWVVIMIFAIIFCIGVWRSLEMMSDIYENYQSERRIIKNNHNDFELLNTKYDDLVCRLNALESREDITQDFLKGEKWDRAMKKESARWAIIHEFVHRL